MPNRTIYTPSSRNWTTMGSFHFPQASQGSLALQRWSLVLSELAINALPGHDVSEVVASLRKRQEMSIVRFWRRCLERGHFCLLLYARTSSSILRCWMPVLQLTKSIDRRHRGSNGRSGRNEADAQYALGVILLFYFGGFSTSGRRQKERDILWLAG